MGSALKVYKASAGAGKTFRLAVEYITLLVEARESAEYSRILAVTFTNKATTEMKDRIISQLYGIGHNLGNSAPYYEALRESLDKDGFADVNEAEVRRRCRLALHQILHDYNRFRVSTIDAFFQMVLRSLAHELGLAANLQVEISDDDVLSEAVDRIVDRLQDDEKLLGWVYSLVRDQIENNQRWDVTGKVKKFARVIFNENYLLNDEELRKVLHDDRLFVLILKEIEQLRNSAIPTVKALGKQLDDAVRDEGVAYTDFSNGGDFAGFVQKLQAGNMTIVISNRLHGWTDDSDTMVRSNDRKQRPQLLQSARRVSAVLQTAIEGYLRCQHDYNSAMLVLNHIKSLRLLGVIADEVTEINAETSRFNLAKTPILLHQMVGESDAPFVFEKTGSQLCHIMIDEFQDTSSLQWKNFRALLLENTAKGGHNLIVGDVKQSIYRWRGGDWRLLGNIESQFVPQPEVVPLRENRRSMKRVVTFNNDFFTQAYRILDKTSMDRISELDEPFSFSTAYKDVEQQLPEGTADEGYVRVKVFDTNVFKNREQWEQPILDDLMEQIRQLHAAGLPYQKMAILVRVNRETKPIIEAFARHPEMPAIVSDEAFLFASSPAIKMLVAALRVIDDHTDQVSAYYLRQFGATDVIDDESLRSLPLYELLETLYQRLHLDRISHQDAYLCGFFDAVVDFTRSNVSDVHSFLTFWDENLSMKSIPAGKVDGIRVMTIHKAKGLEYHTVFMPFCSWEFERDRSTDLIWCSPEEKPFSELPLVPVTPTKAMANSTFSVDYARQHLFSRLDEFNSLYVGFTRARSNLYIWAPGGQKSLSTVGDLVARVFKEDYTVGEPVTTVGKSQSSDNRMTPDSLPLDVTMASYPLTAVFRQSNRSQQFLLSSSDADEFSMSEESRQQQYIETGKLLHSVLQRIRTTTDVPRVLDALEQEGVISRFAPDGTYVAVQRDELQRWLDRGLKNTLVADWFADGWTIFNECSIVRRNPDNGQPQTLRPDRVMMSSDGCRIVVVDFKFGRPDPDYVGQVRRYMELLTAMYPEAAVEGYLWYVYSGRVQRVTPEGAGRKSRSTTPPDSSQLTLDF